VRVDHGPRPLVVAPRLHRWPDDRAVPAPRQAILRPAPIPTPHPHPHPAAPRAHTPSGSCVYCEHS
jgi:hypothetical protein